MAARGLHYPKGWGNTMQPSGKDRKNFDRNVNPIC